MTYDGTNKRVGIGVSPDANFHVVGDTILNGGTALGTNTLDGLGNGDLNASTIYYDTLTAKSPTFLCSEDWCSISFPEYQKTLWIERNETTWEILDIVYEEVSYSKKEFNNQICSMNQNIRNICTRLNEKIKKLQAKAILNQERISCNYKWDGECFEIVKIDSDYINSVNFEFVNITYEEKYLCQGLDDELMVIETMCSRDVVNGIEKIWKFNEDCGWEEDIGYWCEKRILK